ncbi:MAG: hypothetical protein M3O15_05650 [Acidobacteriota bacterium]|nr:hypothetical protein [Acidobacteriota bacterium]
MSARSWKVLPGSFFIAATLRVARCSGFGSGSSRPPGTLASWQPANSRSLVVLLT